MVTKTSNLRKNLKGVLESSLGSSDEEFMRTKLCNACGTAYQERFHVVCPNCERLGRYNV